MTKRSCLALLLAALLTLSLTACGAKKTADAPQSATTATAQPAPAATDAPEPEPTDAPEPEPTDAPEPEATDAPEPEPTDAPKAESAVSAEEEPAPLELLGRLSPEEGLYENDPMKLGCRLPEGGWSMMGREELLEMGGVVADIVSDEAAAEALTRGMESGAVQYVMYGVMLTGGNTSAMVVQLQGTDILVSERMALSASMETSIAEMEGMGMSDVAGELTEVTLGGESRHCLQIRAKYGDTDLFSDTIAIRTGTKMYMINITALSPEEYETIYNCWYPLG